MSDRENPEGFAEWEMVVTRDKGGSSSGSAFPPTNHEDLQLEQQSNDMQLVNSPLSSSSSSSDEGNNAEESHEEDVQAGSEVSVGDDDGIRRRIRLRVEIVRAGFFHLAAKVQNFAVSGIGFWSLVSASGVVVAAVLVSALYKKVRQWRLQIREKNNQHLARLIREKDEKIYQLLHLVEIAEKLLSGRQRVRVPVYRIRNGSESSSTNHA